MLNPPLIRTEFTLVLKDGTLFPKLRKREPSQYERKIEKINNRKSCNKELLNAHNCSDVYLNSHFLSS